MDINSIFNQLHDGKILTLSFPSPQDYTSFYSQLRVTKSRQELKFKSIFDESLFVGKVIRVENVSPGTYKFWLGDPKPRSTIKFEIISVEESPDGTQE